MFAIGDAEWPGLSKLAEECGEVTQVIGKLMGSRGEENHWDGTNLRDRLLSEMSDLQAAIDFVLLENNLSQALFQEMRYAKIQRFFQWHKEDAP